MLKWLLFCCSIFIICNHQGVAQIHSVVDKKPVLLTYKDSLNGEKLKERTWLKIINDSLEYRNCYLSTFFIS